MTERKNIDSPTSERDGLTDAQKRLRAHQEAARQPFVNPRRLPQNPSLTSRTGSRERNKSSDPSAITKTRQ